MKKNILIIGINSELALRTIEQMNKDEYNIYATSRHSAGLMNENIQEFHLDITREEDFIHLKEKFKNIKFDSIINYAGLAIAGGVFELDETELKKQLDTNLFGLLRIIKYLTPCLQQNGKLINISSMASYGIFPFLSPYCLSKAAGDILLNLFSIESKIKVVSIRPGAIATKFWESSLKNNEKTLNQPSKHFQKEKEFLIENAQNNSLHAKNPIYIAKKIAAIIAKKNPKSVYNLGFDAKIAKLTRFLPQNLVNFIIKKNSGISLKKAKIKLKAKKQK